MLPADGLTLVSSCSAESALLADMVATAGDALGAMTFSGIFVAGLNRRTWRAGAASQVLTFFQTPELRADGGRVEFLPLCYQDILADLRARRPQAALLMCTPSDADGICSFGTECAFIAELWREIPVRIAHINPLMPRPRGDAGIPFDALTAFVEAEQPLVGAVGEPDDVARAISGHVAPYIGNGDTLQTGIGRVPDAILASLTGRRNLKLHTGLVGDGALALVSSGALTAATVGCAIGSPALYDAVAGAPFAFRPISVTHGADSLAAIDRLVTINSALEIDLFGQAYAELTPRGMMSGPGGASDYARAARVTGLRIVALPAQTKGVSRIVPPGQGAGPVSLSRMDIDVVATEHGAADLRRLGHATRAAALIAIASPEHRASLGDAWTEYSNRL